MNAVPAGWAPGRTSGLFLPRWGARRRGGGRKLQASWAIETQLRPAIQKLRPAAQADLLVLLDDLESAPS